MLRKQCFCYIVYMSQEVYDMLKEGFDCFFMFNGCIQGLGLCYCFFIEDKIDCFVDCDWYQFFVEFEGWNIVEIYVNGFLFFLLEDVQYKVLWKIWGFENVKMFCLGYVIEYDFFQFMQLKFILEIKFVDCFYFVGQINGIIGYEEAGCQGLIVGINVYFFIREEVLFVLCCFDGYIGVFIDDFVNKGIKEFYCMFIFWAEYCILFW